LELFARGQVKAHAFCPPAEQLLNILKTMYMKQFFAILFLSAIALSSCNLVKEDCKKPRQDMNPTVFINMPANGVSCIEVSEGFEFFLDWPYITGDEGTDREFAFANTDGFDIKEGAAAGRDKPTISLIVRADSPAEAAVEVFAYNTCGESNRGVANIKVRKTPPYAFNPRFKLPQIITHAATFTYQGKGYIVGGARGGTAGTDKTWVYDPTNNQLQQLPAIFYGGEESAAVVGDTAYITRNGGRNFQVYHIPSHTRVREMNQPNTYSDPEHHIVYMFARGNKIYIGPLAPLANIVSYDVTTGVFTNEKSFNLGGVACRSAFYLDNRIYYFFKNGDAFVYNPVLNSVTPFNTPFSVSENVVTSFAVNGKAYVATKNYYYAFNPADNSFAQMQMFNGSECFARGWAGRRWTVSNFVLGDRVYFVGGQETETSSGTTDFHGVKF